MTLPSRIKKFQKTLESNQSSNNATSHELLADSIIEELTYLVNQFTEASLLALESLGDDAIIERFKDRTSSDRSTKRFLHIVARNFESGVTHPEKMAQAYSHLWQALLTRTQKL